MKPIPRDSVRDLAVRAMQNGGKQKGPTKWEWDIAGNCENPQDVQIRSDYGYLKPGQAKQLVVGPDGDVTHPLNVLLAVRCRKCPTCLRARSNHWRKKAYQEYQRATRTWMLTLTLSPHSRFSLDSAARKLAADNGDDLEYLERARHSGMSNKELREVRKDNKEAHRLRWLVLSRELQLYVKRVRKHVSGRLRFMMVVERHQDGTPHMHALFHEQVLATLTKRKMTENWHLGFSMAKLVTDKGGINYVAKYLAKDAVYPIRASVRYGSFIEIDADTAASLPTILS